MKLPLRIFLNVLVALTITPALSAQWVSITASHIQNAAGGLLASGQFCAQPVDNSNHPLLARSGGVGGPIVGTQGCGLITNGVLAGGYTLPDVSQSFPVNLCFRVTIKDSSQNGIAVYTAACVQPADPTVNTIQSNWCSKSGGSTTCDFDLFNPSVAAQIVTAYGPTPSFTADSTTLAPGSSATAVVGGTTASPVIHFGVPQGQKGDKGDTGAPGGVANISTSTPGLPCVYTSTTGCGGVDPTQGATIVGAANASTTPTPLLVGPSNAYSLPLSGFFTGMHNFGTSISYGLGLPTTGACTGSQPYNSCSFPYVINSFFAAPFTAGSTWLNYGYPNDETCDTVKKFFTNEAPTGADTIFRTIETTTNDAAHHGSGAYVGTWRLCEDALLTRAQSTFVRNGSNTTPATNWSVDSAYSANPGLTTTTVGAVQTFDMTGYGSAGNGQPHVYVWYRIFDGGTGSFDVALQGGTTYHVNAFSYPPVATVNGATDSIGSIDIGTTTTANPLVTVTDTAAGTVSIIGVAAAPGYTHQPMAYIFETARVNIGVQSNAATYADYNGYDELLKLEVRHFQSQGFSGLYMLHSRNYFLSPPAQMQDSLHPTKDGAAALAQAVLEPLSATDVKGTGSPFNAPNYRLVNSNTAPCTLGADDEFVDFFTTIGSCGLPLNSEWTHPHLIVLWNSANSPVTLTSATGQSTSCTAVGAVVERFAPLIISSNDGLCWNVLVSRPRVTAVTSTPGYTIGPYDNYIDVTASPVRLTFPTNLAAGKTITIKNLSSDVVLFAGASSGNANGASVLPGQVALATSGPSGQWDVTPLFPNVTTTSALGGSAVAAGACASTTVTVKGAALGMRELAQWVTAYPGDGFRYFAYASASNVVTVKVCNDTAASATPVSTTFNVFSN